MTCSKARAYPTVSRHVRLITGLRRGPSAPSFAIHSRKSEKRCAWRVIVSDTVGLLAPFVLPDSLEPPTGFPVLLNL